MLDLPPDTENRLRDYASREGISVADLITRAFPPIPPDDPKSHVHALLSRRQAQDGTRTEKPASDADGLTPSAALFREWDEEDARLTEDERRAEEDLWPEFTAGLNAERSKAGMRLI